MLLVSVGIGFYFSFKGKQDTVVDYLLGGRRMTVLPISLSIVATFISGISLLGWPAEIYLYGTQMALEVLSLSSIFAVTIFAFLPVYCSLDITSIFEYLELRFSRKARLIGSILFITLLATYMPLVIYVPSLAFKQVTGVSVHVLAPIMCTICVLYTYLGGLRAVAWVDAFQSSFIFLSVIVITWIGVGRVGGLANLIEINERGSRLEFFNMSPDPTDRATFWSVITGVTISLTAFLPTNPAFIQRFLSLPTYKDCIITAVSSAIGIIFLKSLLTLLGLVLYAFYHDCDPVISKVIEKPGQILLLYATDVARSYRGLNGLFLAGIVSAAMSTMSTTLNTVAGVIYEDFIKAALRKPLSQEKATMLIKFLVILMGFFSTAMVVVIERLGTVTQIDYALSGISSGPMVFLFSYGIFFPWATNEGAVGGAIAGLTTIAAIVVGAQRFVMDGGIRYPGKVLGVGGCPANITEALGLNATEYGFRGVGSPALFDDDVPPIFRLSYLHYHTVGLVASYLVAFMVQCLTLPQDLSELDPRLIAPFMRRFLPAKRNEEEEEREKENFMKACS